MTKFGNHWATDAMKIAETFRTTEWDALRRGLEADEADAWLKAANWGQSNISPADARLARALSFNCPTRSVRF